MKGLPFEVTNALPWPPIFDLPEYTRRQRRVLRNGGGAYAVAVRVEVPREQLADLMAALAVQRGMPTPGPLLPEHRSITMFWATIQSDPAAAVERVACRVTRRLRRTGVPILRVTYDVRDLDTDGTL